MDPGEGTPLFLLLPSFPTFRFPKPGTKCICWDPAQAASSVKSPVDAASLGNTPPLPSLSFSALCLLLPSPRNLHNLLRSHFSCVSPPPVLFCWQFTASPNRLCCVVGLFFFFLVGGGLLHPLLTTPRTPRPRLLLLRAVVELVGIGVLACGAWECEMYLLLQVSSSQGTILPDF